MCASSRSIPSPLAIAAATGSYAGVITKHHLTSALFGTNPHKLQFVPVQEPPSWKNTYLEQFYMLQACQVPSPDCCFLLTRTEVGRDGYHGGFNGAFARSLRPLQQRGQHFCRHLECGP